MIDLTCRGAARHGRPIGVCGGLASDPAAAALLVGLGVTELSCTPAGRARREGRDTPGGSRACRKLASAALELASPREVRDLVTASKK
jgi:phosphocarrier protein FPr/phosphocarrier protein